MTNPLLTLLSEGLATQRDPFPDLPFDGAALPAVTAAPCPGTSCGRCTDACPTGAISVGDDAQGGAVAVDRGRCITCAGCFTACPSGTLVADRSTRTAVQRREDLVITNRPPASQAGPREQTVKQFSRSLHVREVSTGCNATDLEVAAATNPVFDVARYGVHFVASPRFADALLVTGPVGRAMHQPLERCYRAMAAPRLVIAAGTCAVSGGLHRGAYAQANGVDAVLPVDVYLPGCPPHPWSIIHALLLAMGRAP